MQKKGHLGQKKISIILALIFTIVVIFIILFSHNKETRTSKQSPKTNNAALYCKGDVVDEPFFVQYNASSSMHEFKILFSDDKINILNYTYTADFPTAEQAINASALIHADYNIFMSKNNVDPESLQPTFSKIDNEVIVNLSADIESISSTTAKLFFLDNEQFKKIPTYSLDEIIDMYRKKGFHCESK